MWRVLVLTLSALAVELRSNSSEWILLHYNECKEPEQKQFKGETLGYVTPWNAAGFDFALKYAQKLDYLVPAWFQLSVADDGLIEIRGDGNSTFTSELQNRNSKVRILPRVILEKTSAKAYHHLLDNDPDIVALADRLVTFCKTHAFKGLTLEIWTQGRNLMTETYVSEDTALQVRLIEKVGKAFKRAALLLILPIPAVRRQNNLDFDGSHFLRLSPFIHRFSLVTYDFSSSIAGPNSPLLWVEGNVQMLMEKFDAEEVEEQTADELYEKLLKQILIGVPFYGYKFTPVTKEDQRKMKTHAAEAITAYDYLDLLNDHLPEFQWSEKWSEHTFVYKESGKLCEVYYPTLTMLTERLKSARRMGVGVALWELGQGLDLFFNLL